MTKKSRQNFCRENAKICLVHGPRTETKFVKWSPIRKRLRTAAYIRSAISTLGNDP